MGNVIDLTGRKFNRWTVLECVGRTKSGGALWRCICECGTIRDVDGRTLRDGTSKSCGCYARERSVESTKIAATKHGGKANGKTERLYGIWCGIKNRCLNPNSKHYHDYGGRGIKVCDEWVEDYAVFRGWAYENGFNDSVPKKYQSLDRVDNDGPYSPDNCAWHTAIQQCNNRRGNRVVEYNGERHTLAEWGRKLNIPDDTLLKRLNKYGYSVEDAFTRPMHYKSAECYDDRPNNRILEYNGEKHSLSEWARIIGIKADALSKRLNKYHYTVEEALTKPLAQRTTNS